MVGLNVSNLLESKAALIHLRTVLVMLTDRKQGTSFFLIYQRDAFIFCMFLMFFLGAPSPPFLTEVFSQTRVTLKTGVSLNLSAKFGLYHHSLKKNVWRRVSEDSKQQYLEIGG